MGSAVIIIIAAAAPQRNLHFRRYHIKNSFWPSHSIGCTCLHTMTTHWILIIIAAAASVLQVLRACKPTFIDQREKDEKRDAPWRTFNFSNILHNIEDSCQCGVRPKSARISGGQDTEKNEFPWQAALVYRNTRIPFCGGTVINNFYVLTAAHCILNLPKIVISTTKDQNDTDFYIENDFQVLLNAHELTPLNDQSAVELYKRTVLKRWYLDPRDAQKDKNEGTLRFDVTKKIFHPEFLFEYQKFGFDYDVALIQLDKPVNFTKHGSPKPICLPKSSKFVLYENTKAMTVGWGRRDFKDMTSGAPILQKLPMPIYSLDDCSAKAGVQVSKRFICAGYHTKQKDIGKSDSGGPLLTEDKGKFTQVGIVSWGAGEKEGKVASAFTRITAFLRWIHYHVDQVETPSDVVWCSRYGPQDFRLEDVRMRPSSSSGEYFEHFHFAPDLSDEDDGLETNGNSSEEILDFMTTETSGVLEDATTTDLQTDAQ